MSTNNEYSDNEYPEIISGRIPKPFRMLLHGVEGIGKSTFAACAPKPIFIPTEEGANEIDVKKFPISTTEDEFRERMNLVRTYKGFQTVVIDTLDWLEKLWVDDILENGKKTIAAYPYGEYYQILEERAKKVIFWLERLRNEKKMNVILIAHSKLDKVIDPTGASYDQYSIRTEKKVSSIFKEWADIVAFANYDVKKTIVREGFGKRTVASVEETFIPSGEGNTAISQTRCLTCTGTPAIVAKCRYKSSKKMNFEEKIPLDGKAFFEELMKIIWG